MQQIGRWITDPHESCNICAGTTQVDRDIEAFGPGRGRGSLDERVVPKPREVRVTPRWLPTGERLEP